jgi:hypothetical protein
VICADCGKPLSGYIDDHVCVIGGEMKYRQLVITDDKQFPVELFMNGRKRQRYTESAAIELMKELQSWSNTSPESETEQKLKEAIEQLTVLRSMTSCFRDLDSSDHYDMLRDIEEELDDFLSTIKEQR